MELFQSYHQHEYIFQAQGDEMRNKVLSQICGSKFCVPKICCSIWIFSPISDTSSKRNPGAFPFETPSWEDGKKKNIIKNSLKKHLPQTQVVDFHCHKGTYDIITSTSLLPVSLSAVSSLFCFAAWSCSFTFWPQTPPMVPKGRTKSIYQGKGRWGPKWFVQHLYTYIIYIYIYTHWVCSLVRTESTKRMNQAFNYLTGLFWVTETY